jgi:hypothetical protein
MIPYVGTVVRSVPVTLWGCIWLTVYKDLIVVNSGATDSGSGSRRVQAARIRVQNTAFFCIEHSQNIIVLRKKMVIFSRVL